MPDDHGPNPSLLWFVGIGAVVILGLVIAARSHHPAVELAGILLSVVSVIGAFKMVAHLQNKAWHGESGAPKT